jgi:long-subunit fatty acid transport protein
LVQAKSDGSASAQFLAIQSGARANGMGEVGVSVVNDVSATYWNPAGLVEIERMEIGLTHMLYLQSLGYDNVSYAVPMGNHGTLAVTGLALYSGSIDKTTEDALGNYVVTNETFNTMESAISVGYGTKIAQDFAIGVNLKTINQRIGDISASGFAGDAGLKYSVSSTIKAGLAVQNIGSAIRGNSLPTIVKAGCHTIIQSLIIAIDSDYALSGGMSYGAGAEYSVMEMIAIRAGYNTRADTNKLTGLHCGMGFNWKGMAFDYAFVPFGDLGSNNVLSVGMKF